MSADQREKTDGGDDAFSIDEVHERQEELTEKLLEDGELSETEMRELHQKIVMEWSIRAYGNSEMEPEDVAEDLELYADVVRGLDE